MAERPWWDPESYGARRANLAARMAVIDAVRAYFRARDFAEVETPALQVSPGLEPHLIAFETAIDEPFLDGPRAPLYLHTSPEFAMKKLLAAGEKRLFQMAKCFRNGERSATHHPEFTMLEWYRADAGYRDLMADCEGLLRAVQNAAPENRFKRGDKMCDAHGEWEYLSVAEAFERHAGIDILATAPDPKAPDTEALRAEVRRAGIWNNPTDVWEDLFFRVFMERIEPNLGNGVPTVVYDYPAAMAALSRIRADDARLAERFELFVCGMELANAFTELTDADEQRRRFEADNQKKRALYGAEYPIDEDFLAALAFGLPQSAGIALGVDRLVMLATGAAHIEDVLWAPVVRFGKEL